MLQQVLTHWNALQTYRQERLRCKNYTYGRQYLDKVSYGAREMTEEEYIRSEGNVPLKNNLIRRIVRNVLGVFRNSLVLPTSVEQLGLDSGIPDHHILAGRISDAVKRDNLHELYCRLMEEYLIGGLVAVRKNRVPVHAGGFQTQDSGSVIVTTDIVRPDSFFFNTDSNDPRGTDVTVVGEIHTVKSEEAVARFAASPEDAERILAYSGHGVDERLAVGESSVRIIELWRRELRLRWLCHDRESGRMYYADSKPSADTDAIWRCEYVWRYYFLAPDGTVLKEGDSPYGEACHPYVFKAYPFIDGEIHSFVADCIDQQRYINRLITLNDWILRSSAKGVLIFPEGSLPEDVDLPEITDQWARYNGVISYRHQDGVPPPHQESSKATNIGVSELLAVQLNMMEDVSGVNSALQGQLTNGAVSGTLYGMQTQQALTGLADIIKGYESFVADSFRKDCRMLGHAA